MEGDENVSEGLEVSPGVQPPLLTGTRVMFAGIPKKILVTEKMS